MRPRGPFLPIGFPDYLKPTFQVFDRKLTRDQDIPLNALKIEQKIQENQRKTRSVLIADNCARPLALNTDAVYFVGTEDSQWP